MMGGDQRNLILAIAVSLAILIGYEAFFAKRAEPPKAPAQRTEEVAAGAPAPPAAPPVPATQAPGGTPPVPATQAPPAPPTPGTAAASARAGLLAREPRLEVRSRTLAGSVSLVGARIDDLTLLHYGASPSPQSPRIVLFSPPGEPAAYFAQFGWSAGTAGVALPDGTTRWQASAPALTPDTPVELRWENGQGLAFIIRLELDRGYVMTVTQRVENAGETPVTLYPFSLISRSGTPKVTGYFILHEGLIGVLDGILKEIDYDDLQESKTVAVKDTGGWIGITDKYWLAAIAPEVGGRMDARFSYHLDAGRTDKYQVDYLGKAIETPPGEARETKGYLFGGAKEVQVLDRYRDTLGLTSFDKAVDFGWFYWLTKPIFYALDWLNKFLGNFGLAILALTVAVKLAFFPLANKSYRSMSRMKKLQPEMMKIRERCGDDRVRMNQEIMALYKREKANPASGCLPMVIQIPVFFALYKVLFVTIEMRHAPFYGWIKDLSAPDPTSIFNLFGLIPWSPPEVMMVGAWPLIMGLTMFVQQRLNPQPPDPIQAKVFLLMPIVFTFLLAQFPAGLVIYWAWNNVLSVLQQWVIMKRMGVPT
ncbi:MAG: membrane protein insertase YidC [Proteobacteria bacterium]|nr:membrane protein insertase YidC [Pseudomonadota bacterium]